MTPAQLEQQSRDAVIAYLQDSSVILEWAFKDKPAWSEIVSTKITSFNLEGYYYRIAHPKPWYRVALFDDHVAVVDDSDVEESIMQQCENFIKWLTDRIPYDN